MIIMHKKEAAQGRPFRRCLLNLLRFGTVLEYNQNKKTPGKSPKAFIISGAGEGIRTSDLLITSQLLYQLSYTGAAL